METQKLKVHTKKYFKILISLTISFFFLFNTGCWDRTEIEELAFVIAMGLDEAKEIPDGVRVSVQVVDPAAMEKTEGKGGGGEPVVVISAEGRTVFQAIRRLAELSPKRVFFEQMIVVVIGEEFAKKGISRALDFIERDDELRRSAWAVVCTGEAEKLLELKTNLESVPGKAIMAQIQRQGRVGTAYTTRVGDIIQTLGTKGKEPAISRIYAIKGDGGDKPDQLRINGTAVFKEDKLVGWLTPWESKGLLWITGNIKSTIVSVNMPEEKREVSFETRRASGNIEPYFEDGKIWAVVEVIEEGIIGEKVEESPTETAGYVEELEQIKTKAIEKEIKWALEKGQKELKSDIFGFGSAFAIKYPKLWKEIEKDWPEIFPELEVKLDVQAHVRDAGMIMKPHGE